jgi:hypothetical protein
MFGFSTATGRPHPPVHDADDGDARQIAYARLVVRPSLMRTSHALCGADIYESHVIVII